MPYNVFKNIRRYLYMAQSFRDLNGKDIRFEDKNELYLEEQNDVVTGEITAYLVNYNDLVYEVNKKTYEALSNL